MAALCVMTFFGLCSNYAYFIYVTNYVGEVIYAGDPLGEAGSEAYENYVTGVHTASLGMLTFYCLFVTFNVLHDKVLGVIGMRAEYLASSVGVCVMTLTLALTDSVVVFFLNALTMAVFRSAVYTVPFMLANKYSQQQNESSTGSTGPSESTGSSIAAISAMIPASYCLVSLLMGPLLQVSGNPASPVIFASVSAVLGMASACTVTFH